MPTDERPVRSELRLASQLHRLSQLLSRPFVKEYASELNLSHAEWRAFIHVVQRPGMTVSDVGVATGFTAMHASRAITALRERGLLQAAPDPHDSRRLLLSPSDSGSLLFAELAPRAQASVRKVMSVLSEDEFNALTAYVDRVIESAEEL